MNHPTRAAKPGLALALVLVLALAAGGCRSRAERYVDEHPDRPAEIRDAMLADRLMPGMTTEEVRIVRGVPHRTERFARTDDAGTPMDQEIWYYGETTGVGVGVGGVRVVVPLVAVEGVTQVRFENGRVVEIAESR